jgi:hypothetical protein
MVKIDINIKYKISQHIAYLNNVYCTASAFEIAFIKEETASESAVYTTMFKVHIVYDVINYIYTLYL